MRLTALRAAPDAGRSGSSAQGRLLVCVILNAEDPPVTERVGPTVLDDRPDHRQHAGRRQGPADERDREDDWLDPARHAHAAHPARREAPARDRDRAPGSETTLPPGGMRATRIAMAKPK